MTKEETEQKQDEPTEQLEDDMNPPELDETKPYFTIGYDANNKDHLVTKKGEAWKDKPIDELEFARMLTTAQFQNAMGFFNRMLRHREQVEKAMKEKRAKDAVKAKTDERRAKKPKKLKEADDK